MTCCVCDNKADETVCRDCWERLLVNREDVYDILFHVSEIANHGTLKISEILELITNLSEAFNRFAQDIRKRRDIRKYSGKWSDIKAEFKKDYFLDMLDRCKGNQSEVARRLKLYRPYVSKLVNEYAREKKHEP